MSTHVTWSDIVWSSWAAPALCLNSTGLPDSAAASDDAGTNVDMNMEVESPVSAELAHLGDSKYSDNSEVSDDDSEVNSVKEVQLKDNNDTRMGDGDVTSEPTSPRPAMSEDGQSNKENKDSDGQEPLEKKARKMMLRHSMTPEKTASPDIRSRMSESFTCGSRPTSAASSSSLPKDNKDPARREKDREREERIRSAQQKLAEERRKKIDEMREQQRLAQENREKQLEVRRRKIDDMKRREEERRRNVEDRRKNQDITDKAKKEAILNKAKERLTRYEQWKTGGRKGLAPGMLSPNKQMSVSTSVLYQKRSTDFASTGALNTSGVGGLKSGAESLMALNTIPENRLGRSVIASSGGPARAKSTVTIGVKMRDNKSPRKPRPSSVATSMPSFVRIEGDSPSSSRSKSTDRGARDRSRPGSGKKEVDKMDVKDRKAATLPRPHERRKIEERRQEVKKKSEEREKVPDKTPARMTKSAAEETKGSKEKTPVRMTRSFIERMAVPKHPSAMPKEPEHEESPVKVVKRNIFVDAPTPPSYKAKKQAKEKADKAKATHESPAKSPHKSALKPPKEPAPETNKEPAISDSPRSDSPRRDSPRRASPRAKSASPALSQSPVPHQSPARHVTIHVDETKDEPPSKDEEIMKSESPDPIAPAEPDQMEPDNKTLQTKPKQEPRQLTPEPKVDPKSAPKSDKEREMEEYKAKLAEKRKLAREKAEREAEIERLRHEELQRQEEERRCLEEERHRREEEEALRLAEEARHAEELRLQRAIEQEERRRHDEMERQERERKAREEAEKRAKEEAERLEKERLERSKREEEERLERKKRLEMIMKRVKTDSTTPEKHRTESPPMMTLSSGPGSLVSSEDEKGDDSEKEDKKETLKPDADDTPKFRSPLLQIKTDDADSGAPKFKSPLLQSLMGKTKLGSRLSASRLDEVGKTGEIEESGIHISKSTSDLPDKTHETRYTGHVNGEAEREHMCDSTDDILQQESVDSRRDTDSHEVVDTVIEVPVVRVNDPFSVNNVEPETDKTVSDSQLTVASVDSAVSLSYNGVSSQNGDLHLEPRELIDSKELVDSSISMRTVDSFGSSQSDSIGDSITLTTSQCDSTQFEDIIDLTVTNKALKDTYINHSEDLLNLNNIDSSCITPTGDALSRPGKPIIAFEDNAARRQDVPDVLS